jgi:hypothetical protein
MDPNCKLVHVHAYTVPRSVEEHLKQSKEIVRLADIRVLEQEYSSELDSPSFVIPKKNGSATIRVGTNPRNLNLFLNRKMLPVSFSKDWKL